MKKILLFIVVVLCASSCRITQFGGNQAFYGQSNETKVVLSTNNFRVLGTFTGHATSKVNRGSIKDKDALVTSAKLDFLKNAKAAGVELTGSRAIINTCVDYMENKNSISVTFSGEIIEFTK